MDKRDLITKGFLDGLCLGTLHRAIERRLDVEMPMGIVPYALTWSAWSSAPPSASCSTDFFGNEKMRFGNHLNIEITVKVADLIAALKANREKHIVEYQDASAAYLEQVRECLEEFRRSAEAGVIRPDNYAMRLNPPVNATQNYDQYIRMFEMSQDETIKIAVNEYSTIVEDAWDWAQNAKVVNAFYTESRKSMRADAMAAMPLGLVS